MDRIFHFLRPAIMWVTRNPWLTIGLAFVFSVVGGYGARTLQVDTDLANLLPDDYPSVVALEELRSVSGGESALAIGITSPSFEANKAIAQEVIDRLTALEGPGLQSPVFTRVDYIRETEFLEMNAGYFATREELDQVEDFLRDELEQAKLEANPFYFDIDEDDTDAASDSTTQELRRTFDRLVAKQYPISSDSTTMAIHFVMSASNTNIGALRRLYDAVEAEVDRIDVISFHPEMEVVVAGRPFRRLSEVSAITQDVARSFGIGIGSVMLLVALFLGFTLWRGLDKSERTVRAFLITAIKSPFLTLLISVPLCMSLAWTFGLTAVVLGSLNLMTSTLGLVLFGLGIDFGIHYYARYVEYRSDNMDPAEATINTFMTCGQAVAVGAFSTAAGLLVLTMADFKGFSEFGFVSAAGIAFALVAMLLVLPALILVFERFNLILPDTGDKKRTTTDHGTGPIRFYRPVAAVGVIMVVVAVINYDSVGFEYNFGTLEPVYHEYNQRQDVIGRVVGSQEGRRNPAYFVVDSIEVAADVARTVRDVKEAEGDSSTVGIIESLSDRFPYTPEMQQEKLAALAGLRELLDDRVFADNWSNDLQRIQNAVSTSAPIPEDMIPADIRREFSTRDGALGRLVIVYPAVSLSDARRSVEFSEDIGTIIMPDGVVRHAASSSLVAADMLTIMMSESFSIVLLSLLAVFLLMLLHFRSLSWALITMTPLIVGILWMLLLMEVFGLSLNFYNLIVLPAVMGIGNDDGVHVVQRYIEEGRGSLKTVMKSTGQHIFMTTLTTAVGFSGLLFSFHPGLQSIGILAVVGIGSVFVSSLLFLPATLQLLEDAIPSFNK